MRTVALVFPNQLFAEHPALRQDVANRDVEKVCLVEEPLFFGDNRYPLRFHRQKLAYHLATMDAYETMLAQRFKVERIRYTDSSSQLPTFIKRLAEADFSCVFR